MFTLGDISRKGARLYPNAEATVFNETRLTYKQLDENVNRLANAILNLGYKKGENLTVLAENTHKYVEVYLAAGKLGMVVTPLNFRLSERELSNIITDCGSTLFFVGEDFEELADVLRKNLKNIRNWVCLDNQRQGFLFYGELLKNGSTNDPLIDVSENDLAILMYTGGTTGLPKGVMLSHRNLTTASYLSIIGFSLTKNDSHCIVLPLFHISFWPVISILMVGGKVVIIKRPDVVAMCKAIHVEKCTLINMVPTVYSLMLNTPELDEYDLSSLRIMSYGGSPIAPDVLKRLINKFGNKFHQIYGMTEASGVTAILYPEDHVLEGDARLARRLTSAGREGILVDIRVADDNCREVKPGEAGEIVLRGRSIMTAYWKKPELTQEAYKGGWFHTGDVGTVDEDGYIYLLDRKADMIVTGGENVYPKEVESVLYENPAVVECAVVSSPDQKWGERVTAVVCLKADAAASPEELIAHCKKSLAGYKCPKEVYIWDAIPKTSVGKISRKDVKAHFWKGFDRSIG